MTASQTIHNIVIKRFFRTLKHGNVYINDYQTIRELKEGVKAYMQNTILRDFAQV